MQDLIKLIEEYKEMTSISSKTDYEDKKSVKRHNESVDRMYKIIDSINSNYEEEGINEFAQLLNINTNKISVWVAVQMLEKRK